MKKYRKQNKKKLLFFTVLLPVFLLLSYGAISIGVTVGNLVFNLDEDFAGEVDAENLKSAINYTIPLFNSVYNSGSTNMSLAGEIEAVFGSIFSFNLGTPATIINAEYSSLHWFYKSNYLPRMAERMAGHKEAEPPEDARTPPEDGKNAENPPEKDGTGLKEDMSYITYEGESEEKQPDAKIITDGKIQLQNEAGLDIDVEKLLKEPLNINFQKKGPRVLIYHTHTTEGYLMKLSDLDKKDYASWSRDPKNNIVRVGNELAVQMEKKYGIDVLHNGTVHDIPNHDLAYGASLKTLNSYLKSHPSLQITVDVHRDASGNQKLRLPVKVGDKNAAQIMFVLGTKNPNWKENLKLVLRMQQKANELYPGLAKPIWLAKNKVYNQHLRYGSFTVEIGGDGNTLDEAVESSRYLAVIMGEVLKEIN